MQKPVIIAGAGPVGLSLALLLDQRGVAVEIYEAVRDLEPLGVGINLLPHSVRVLDGLGLDAELDRIGVRTSALHYYNKLGQAIWREPRGMAAGYEYPQYSIHRGEFQALLLQTVRDRLGAERIHTDHALTDWRELNADIEVSFGSASGEKVTVEGACLVAADGIRSAARRKLYPDEGDPIYGGRILWRGVTRSHPFLDGRTMFMAGHESCKFVAYAISAASATDGTASINWIAELSVPDWQAEAQDWNREAPIDRFAASFAHWDFGWVDIPALIRDSERVYEFPLSDRDPLPRWSQGRMTLVGDAAHPMYPIGSNGASQGILDAEKLAFELVGASSVEAAFAAYESERRPATSELVLLNRQNGPEQVMQLAEERAPDGFEKVEDVIPKSELEEIAARYKQTAGFTVHAVNQRTPANPQ